MGSDKTKDPDASDNELPQQRMGLPTFWIARTPLTVAQFAQFVTATNYKTTAEKQGSAWGYTGSKWEEIKGAFWQQPRGPESDVQQKADHPVTCVSWHDALAFCQ
jgi:sulfatase modifying factor 1